MFAYIYMIYLDIMPNFSLPFTHEPLTLPFYSFQLPPFSSLATLHAGLAVNFVPFFQLTWVVPSG